MDQRKDWFSRARFGMMAHWGIYSVIGRGEWVLNRERMPWDEYQQAAPDFTAENFHADEWAELAVAAGQTYLILTAKHHDGFCLWDTKTTTWNSVQLGPRRDLVAELVEAFHKRGLKIGFFFSMADWSHPDYPTAYATDWPEAWGSEQRRRNVVEYDLAQIEELCGNYGPIDVLWFDGAAPGMSAESWDAERIFALARRHNPDVLINNRLFLPGDFDALELHLNMPKDKPWESDYTLNDSWAWNPDDHNYKSPLDIWRRLLAVNGQGGNLLLNMSPRADGSIPEREQSVLREVGARLRKVGPVDFGPEARQLRWVQGGIVTGKDNVLYLHFWHRHGDELAYGGVRNKVLRATLVGEERELPFHRDLTGRLRIRGLEDAACDELGYCVRLELDGSPEGFGVGHQDLNF